MSRRIAWGGPVQVHRRGRLLAATSGLAALLAVGAGAFVAPGDGASAVAAPRAAAPRAGAPQRLGLPAGVPATTTVSGDADRAVLADPAYPHPSPQASSGAPADASATYVSGAAIPAAARAASAVRSRTPVRTALALTVRPGARLTVTAVLSRASNRVRIAGRLVEVWTRTADTGAWRRVLRVRTSSRGIAVATLADRPSLQVTLRFTGDGSFGPAASVTLVPEPTGARGLDPRLVRALGKARAAARRAGLVLVLNSGYRSWAEQLRMYQAAVRSYGSAAVARLWVLPPSESTHVRGLAVDVGTPATARWLEVHGAAWDLCRAYGDEPWHFEYRPDWVAASGGRCPAPVPVPGDPDPSSPLPHVPVVF
jgi:D-alanyl-D-alanine carboxypeptidase